MNHWVTGGVSKACAYSVVPFARFYCWLLWSDCVALCVEWYCRTRLEMHCASVNGTVTICDQVVVSWAERGASVPVTQWYCHRQLRS